MMKKATKIFMTGAASLLGVALATGGAYATTGSLTTVDTPGKVIHVSGVGPASKHASETALMHANPNAKGLFGWSEPTEAPVAVAPDPVVKDDAAPVQPVKDKSVKDKPVKVKPAKIDKVHHDKAVKHENCSKNRHSGWADHDKARHDHKKFHKADHKKAHHVESVAAGDAVEVTKHFKRSHQDDSRHSSRSHDRDGSRDGGDRHRDGGRTGGHHSGGSRG